MLPSFEEYNRLVYSVIDIPSVKGSTLVLKPIGATVWELEGEVTFGKGITLSISEQINFELGIIARYFYLVCRGDERLYWYDPQPHPHDSALASTHPHHKHVPPDIKHNRIPASDLSFDKPNLPFLIEEIERELLTSIPELLSK